MSMLLWIIGGMLFVEGALYTLFPNGMKRMMLAALQQPENSLRYGGLAMAILGAVLIYATK